MGSGWGQIDSVRASCERCGKPATIVVVTQRTVSVIDLANRQRRPEVTGTWIYPLGTDSVGRDVFSRLIYGTRTSLIVLFGRTATTAPIKPVNSSQAKSAFAIGESRGTFR